MTDLRDKLAAALGKAIDSGMPVGVPDVLEWPEYLADILLALPGIAIVTPEMLTVALRSCYDRGTELGPQFAADLFLEFKQNPVLIDFSKEYGPGVYTDAPTCVCGHKATEHEAQFAWNPCQQPYCSCPDMRESQ